MAKASMLSFKFLYAAHVLSTRDEQTKFRIRWLCGAKEAERAVLLVPLVLLDASAERCDNCAQTPMAIFDQGSSAIWRRLKRER
jgi:hypothetical protein